MADHRDVGQHLAAGRLLRHRTEEPQHIEMAEGTKAQGFSFNEIIVRRIEHTIAMVDVSQQPVDISNDFIEIVVEV